MKHRPFGLMRESIAALSVLAVLDFGIVPIANAQGSENIARGVLRSLSRAEIGTELVAAISDIPFRSGERFKAGDTLIAFSCGKYEAEGRSAIAIVEAKQLSYKSKQLLRSKNAIGQFEVDVAGAELREAKARLDGIQVQIDQCTVKAPFDGRIIQIFRQAHEFSRANEPLLAIVDDQSLEIDLIVPSNWLSWLQVGSEFSFAVDETRVESKAKVTRIGAEVDAVSQTIQITGLFTKNRQNNLPGMSGTARFE